MSCRWRRVAPWRTLPTFVSVIGSATNAEIGSVEHLSKVAAHASGRASYGWLNFFGFGAWQTRLTRLLFSPRTPRGLAERDVDAR
jgi:hypothetical protein